MISITDTSLCFLCTKGQHMIDVISHLQSNEWFLMEWRPTDCFIKCQCWHYHFYGYNNNTGEYNHGYHCFRLLRHQGISSHGIAFGRCLPLPAPSHWRQNMLNLNTFSYFLKMNSTRQRQKKHMWSYLWSGINNDILEMLMLLITIMIHVIRLAGETKGNGKQKR